MRVNRPSSETINELHKIRWTKKRPSKNFTREIALKAINIIEDYVQVSASIWVYTQQLIDSIIKKTSRKERLDFLNNLLTQINYRLYQIKSWQPFTTLEYLAASEKICEYEWNNLEEINNIKEKINNIKKDLIELMFNEAWWKKWYYIKYHKKELLQMNVSEILTTLMNIN